MIPFVPVAYNIIPFRTGDDARLNGLMRMNALLVV